MKFLILIAFSVNSLAMSLLTDKPEELHDVLELHEIKFFGDYFAGDPGEIERSEKYYREAGVLKEGESLADSWQTAHKLEYLGKERFDTSSKPLIYCYNKISDEDRESALVFNPNLRARMYDENENLLAEDILRDSHPGRDPFVKLTVAYLPYLKNGDVIIRVIRLEKEGEVVLYELKGLNSHENLQAQEHNRNPYGYRLDKHEKTPCYM